MIKGSLRLIARGVDAFGRGLQANHGFVEILSKHQSLNAVGGASPVVHSSTFVASNASIVGDVHVGRSSSVWYGGVIRADQGSSVRIGENSNVQEGAVIFGDRPTVIGQQVTIGHGANLRGCTVGNNTIIGVGAMVLTGATVGENSIVGAGAVVGEGVNVPAKQVWAGNPAKFLRDVTNDDVAHIRITAASLAESAVLHAKEAAKDVAQIEKEADEDEDEDPVGLRQGVKAITIW